MSDTHSETVAFVAESQIPPSPPPSDQVGVIGWMKSSLFSSITNSILTILSIAAIVLAVPALLNWAYFDAVFDAGSLSECREIARGNGVEGPFACWAVIVARFDQFLFGFYPESLRWRPILTFVLLFGAIAPVLFTALPRKLLWFTAVYPVIAYFLIWGGSIWGPVTVVAGFALAGWLLVTFARQGRTGLGILFGLLALLLWMFDPVGWVSSLFGAGSGSDVGDGLGILPLYLTLDDGLTAIAPIGLEPVPSDQLGGFLLSLIIGLSGIAGSLPLGILLALGRQSNLFILKTICVGFIEFIRGVPLITLLFVASTLLNYFLPPGTNFDLILRVVIMVTLFASAYMAEVIRGGLAALAQGQYEAADALGLDYWKSMRLVILPQALKISIPGIVNTFIGLFKDTTLVSVIGLLDPLGITNPIRADSNWNGIVWELYVFVALFFFVFCFSMSRYSMYLERKLATGHR